MKNRFFICLFVLIGLGGSCKKESLPNNPPLVTAYKTKLDIKWHRYFYSDTTVCYIMNPYINDNYVGFSSNLLVTNKTNALGIGIFDKKSGAFHTAWNGNPGINLIPSLEYSDWCFGGINNDLIFTNDRKKVDCYSISSGSHLWSIQENNLAPRIRTYNDLLFISSYDMHSFSKLFVYNISTASLIRTINFYKTDGYETSIEPPGVWINPDGDTVLIFQNRQWNFPASDGKVDLYAYNMRTDSILWKIDDISNDGNSSVYPPIIDGNRAYFQGIKSLHGINLLTGQLIWEHEYMDEGFAQVENIFADGKLFVHSGSDALMAFDVVSGNLIWKTPKHYGIQEVCRMDYYQGKIYFTSIDMTDPNVLQLLFCINASNGNLIWKESGVRFNGMTGGVCIDKSTGYLYCNDAISIMCIDLNNSPIKK